MKNTLLDLITSSIKKLDTSSYKLLNGDYILLSPAVQELHKQIPLDTFLARIVKHQENQAVKRQVFQVWQLINHRRDELAMIIRDRYNEILVYESFPDYDKLYPEIRLYLIDGKVLYLPQEIN